MTSNISTFSANYLKSALDLTSCPQDDIREIAFVGRSNSGKSSTINRICDSKSLARVSKTPGRTQLINFFEVQQGGRLVDLPGYGYAHASKSKVSQWNDAVHNYLEERTNLVGVIIIVDSRLNPQTSDTAMIQWCISHNLPLLILLNKSDKAKQKERSSCMRLMKQLVPTDTPSKILLFSALKGIGLTDARVWIQTQLNEI